MFVHGGEDFSNCEVVFWTQNTKSAERKQMVCILSAISSDLHLVDAAPETPAIKCAHDNLKEASSRARLLCHSYLWNHCVMFVKWSLSTRNTQLESRIFQPGCLSVCHVPPVDAHLHVHRNVTVASLLNIAAASESEQKQQLLQASAEKQRKASVTGSFCPDWVWSAKMSL